MIEYKAQLLDPDLPQLTLGEGPHWDERQQVLYYVDIVGRCVHRYDPATRKHRSCLTPSMVGFAVLEDGDENDRLAIGLQDGLYRLNFTTGECNALVKPQGMASYNRFNDAKTDPSGERLWAGTMNLESDETNPTGALYRLDEKGLIQIQDKIAISNGLGWTADGARMFHTDTLREDGIYVYDYDRQTGAASNGRAFTTAKSAGNHDGLAVDRDGCVLTAKWGGSAVEIYVPDGTLIGKISVPAPHVSSCAFGGKDLKTLFITTARDGLSDADLKDAPLSGHVFTARMDVPGVPVPRFRCRA